MVNSLSGRGLQWPMAAAAAGPPARSLQPLEAAVVLLRGAMVLLLVLVASLGLSSAGSGSSDSSSPAPPRRSCEPGGVHAALPVCNSSLPLEARLDDLIGRASIEELMAQLLLGPDDSPGLARLGVPPMGTAEALHGVCTALDSRELGCLPAPGGCATAFPAPLALGATFDTQLFFNIGRAIAAEARAINNFNYAKGNASTVLFRHHNTQALVFFAPNVNLIKDPRWGRSQEVAGEDPTLASSYASAYVRGMQRGQTGKLAANSTSTLTTVAVCKHFKAYDFEGGSPSGYPADVDRFHVDVNVSKRDMAEYYLKPLKACVVDGGAQGVMCAYPSVNGVPSCADGTFQNDMLRDEWGFKGFIVSDAGAAELTGATRRHPVLGQPAVDALSFNYTDSSLAETCAANLLGGMDLDLPEGTSNGPLVLNASVIKSALNKHTKFGTLTENDIRRAARRVLRTSFLLGELDGPEAVPQQRWGPELVDSKAHQALALQAARSSIVLLENPNRTLPLATNTGSGIAFIGPQANVSQGLLSDYHGLRMDMDSQSPLHVARSRGMSVSHALGCGLATNASDCASEIDLAVALARRSETVVLFLGLCGNNRAGPGGEPGCVGGATVQETEGADRTSLELPGGQKALLQKILATGTKTIVVLITGGAVAVDTQRAAAVVYAPYGGQSGGDAIVDVLTGVTNPSGKSPVTWYPAEFINTRPSWQMDLRAGGGVTHMHYSGTPLYRFGTGLSYTDFTYSVAERSIHEVATTHSITSILSDRLGDGNFIPHTVTVTNSGSRSGEAVVLGFVSSSHPQFPRQKLFGFQRVGPLAPGTSVTASLRLQYGAAEALAVIDDDGRAWLEPAEFMVRMGDVVNPAVCGFTLTVRTNRHAQ